MKIGKERIFIILVVAYFLLCVLSFVNTYELDDDEAMPGSAALRLVSLIPDVFIPHADSLIMFSPYEGRPVIFIQGLLFYFFSPSVFFLRLPYVIIGGIVLILIYYVCRSWFNKRVALLTFSLAAINTPFIKASAQGDVRDEIFQIFIFWLGIATIQFYISKRKKIYLYLSGLIFGIGLWAKLMFLGYMFGVGVACLVVSKKPRLLLMKIIFIKKRDAIYFFVAFLIGCSPLLYFNIITGNATLSCIIKSFGINASGAWDNHNFLPNLCARLYHLNYVLAGFMPREQNSFFSFVFYVSFLTVIIYLVLRKKDVISRSKILFLVLLYLTLLILSCFTPGGRADPGHLLVLFPFPQLIIALCLNFGFSLLSKKILRVSLALVFLLLCIEQQIATLRSCKDTYSVNKLKTQIQITNYLLKHHIGKVFTFNPNILKVVDFLSKGKVITYGYNGLYSRYYDLPYRWIHRRLPYFFEVVYRGRLQRLSQFYLISNDNNFSYNMRYRLETRLKKDGKNLFMIKEFKNSYSDVEFRLYLAH